MMLNCDLAFASLAGQCADRADSQACYHQSSHLLGTDVGVLRHQHYWPRISSAYMQISSLAEYVFSFSVSFSVNS